MCKYKVNTQPSHKRKELIKQAVEASEKKYTFHEYQNTPSELTIVRIPIGIPLYRMENYRTRTAQMKYVQVHQKNPDFFKSGQENESAQQAQHVILVDFAKKGKENSVLPIFEELEAEPQREPLLATTGGIIVNGNRRLAAMRELSTERPNEFGHFLYVDCAVLPENVTSREVIEIEVRLQMRPETKLPYSWVNESIAIKELQENGLQADYVANLMKKRKKTIEMSLRALNEADIYLKEWLKKPGEYQHVENSEQFFKDLANATLGKESDLLEVSRRIGWTLLSSEDRTGRLYGYNFSFDKQTEDVVSALADRLQVDLTPQEDDQTPHDDIDIDIDDDDSPKDTSLEPLIEVFDDLGQRQLVSEQLIEVCDIIREQNRNVEIGRQALNAVKAANTKLQEVDLTKADPKTYKSIDSQISSLMERTEKLRTRLATLLNEN